MGNKIFVSIKVVGHEVSCPKRDFMPKGYAQKCNVIVVRSELQKLTAK